MNHHRTRLLVAILLILSVDCVKQHAQAGMPAALPSSWTADRPTPNGYGQPNVEMRKYAPFLQAISFFVAVVLGAAWIVRRLVNVLRKDWTFLPELGYRRALSFVILWGLFFVVVLTMISGARELMTPGAWQKQGWTYRLKEGDSASPEYEARRDREARRAALEKLRTALWHHAATHQGSFPTLDDFVIDPDLWKVPHWPGLHFLLVPNRRADETGRVLVFEPNVDGDDRLVLLTNGLIGSMTTDQINRQLDSQVATIDNVDASSSPE